MLRRAIAAVSITFSLSCALVACSLDTSGSASDDSLGDGAIDSNFGGLDSGPAVDSHFGIDTGASDAPVVDSVGDSIVAADSVPDSITTPPDTTPESPTCDTSACGSPPAGSKRLALVDRSVACPAGFKQTDVVEATTGDACGCSCTLAAPACSAKVDIPTAFSDDGSCGFPGTTLHPMTSGGCINLGFTGTLHADFSATPPDPTGGGCTPKGTNDPAKDTAQKRLCEPGPSSCFGDVCGGAFDECIETSSTCPAGYPNAHTVGTSVGVSCPTCDCAFDAGKCTGTIDLYSGGSCAGTKTSLAANGTCVPTGGTKSVQSYDYVPSPPSASCTPSYATDPGTPSVGGPRTLCCR